MSDRPFLRQRHFVTVVVCDISESTSIAERIELEEYSSLLHEMREEAEAIVSEHGGSIIRIDGDGLIFLFGYPDSYEDAAKRAIDSSLKLREWAHAFSEAQVLLDEPLRLHIGIHSGLVLLQEGDLSRGRFEILGDTTNVASRLCELAESNEIIISCDALGADRYFFKTTAPELTKIRSRTKKLFISRVLGRRNSAQVAAPNLRREASYLIGREKEIELLLDILNQKRDEKVAIVRSEAGMGKSRLLSEVLAISNNLGYSSHWCYCRSYLGSAELEPIKQLSESLLQIFSFAKRPNSADLDCSVAEVDALAALVSPETALAAASDLKRLVAGVSFVVKELCKSFGGAIIFLDDWHWADDSSQAFLDLLIKAEINNLLIVVAKRLSDSDAESNFNTVVVDLEPLSRAETASLVEIIEPTLDELAVSEIHRLSGGNPLFIEELSHASRRNSSSHIIAQSGAWLEALIQARFATLEVSQRRALEIASAIGNVVPLWLLSEVVGSAATNGLIDSLQRENFLFPSETHGHYRFKHGIACEAIYSLVEGAEKKKINALIAEKFVAHGMKTSVHADPGELARYYYESGNIERGVECSIQAGDAAVSKLALDKAQFHFLSALNNFHKLGSSDDEFVFLLRRYGQACIVDPNWEMIEVMERMIALANKAGHTRSVLWAEYYLAFIQYGLGNAQQAIRHYTVVQQAAKRIEENDLVARVEASLGQVHAAACSGEKALDALDRSIAVQRKHIQNSRAPVPLAYSMACKSFTLMDMGKTQQADSLWREVSELIEFEKEWAHLSIYAYRGGALMMAGRFEEAFKVLQIVSSAAGEMRSRFHISESFALMNIARFYLCGSPVALKNIQTSTSRWAAKSHQHISLAYSALCDGHVRLGNLDVARVFAAKTLTRAEAGDRLGETVAYRSLALISLKSNEMEDARKYLKKAYASALRRQSKRDELLTNYFEQITFGKCEIDPQVELRMMKIDPAKFFHHPNNSGRETDQSITIIQQ